MYNLQTLYVTIQWYGKPGEICPKCVEQALYYYLTWNRYINVIVNNEKSNNEKVEGS